MSEYLIKPHENYVVLSESDFVQKTVMNFIITTNKNAGVHDRPSLVGKHIVVRDDAKPLKNRIVLSKVKREEQEFKTINVDKQWNKIFSQIFNFNYNSNLYKYVPKDMGLDRLYHIFALLSGNSNNTMITDTLFKKAISGEYSLSFSYHEKIEGLMIFVQNLDYNSLQNLLKIMDEDSYGWFVATISALVDDQLSPYYKEKYEHMTSNSIFLKNLLRISVILIKTEHFEDAILSFYRLCQ